MKRSGIKRKTALVAKSEFRRNARLPRVSVKRAPAVANGARATRRRDTGPSAAVRRLVALRSGGVCEFPSCVSAAEHQHHRRPRRMGGSTEADTNLPANLLHLCLGHHEWTESHRADALLMGLLLHAHHTPALVPVRTRHAIDPIWLTNAGGWAHDFPRTTNQTQEG